MNKLDIDLNPSQDAACRCLDGPVCVLAGAGSGKTSILIARICYMIKQGIAPKNILAITFTKKAAAEMKTRLISSIGQISQDIYMGTFHAFCYSLLLRYADKLDFFPNRFSLFNDRQATKLLKTCIRDFKLDDNEDYSVNAVRKFISINKNKLISWEDLYQNKKEDEVYIQLFEEYQKRLIERNGCDFDDLLIYILWLFEHYPNVLKECQEKYQYILIDEYQDTNIAQYNIIKAIASKTQNVFVVGDIDQAIYSFRGADYHNILLFHKDFPTAKEFILNENYRSTKTILSAANAVISNNTQREGKKLWTDLDDGDPITLCEAITDSVEANWVAREIQSLRLQGYGLKDICVLVRQHAQSRVFEDAFRSRSLPFSNISGIDFYQRTEIKDVISYLRIVDNPMDTNAILQIINRPSRGITSSVKEILTDVCLKHGYSFWEGISLLLKQGKLSSLLPDQADSISDFYEMVLEAQSIASADEAVEVMRFIIDSVHYKRYLKKLSSNDKDLADRNINLSELESICMSFAGTKKDRTLSKFLLYVDFMSTSHFAEGKDIVKIMTVHTAKGLEFPCVFVSGLNENLFPIWQAIKTGNTDMMEEERRLFYVAMTRAEKKLFLTFARKNMWGYKMKPSRFIKEIPDSCILQKDFIEKVLNG